MVGATSELNAYSQEGEQHDFNYFDHSGDEISDPPEMDQLDVNLHNGCVLILSALCMVAGWLVAMIRVWWE